MTSDEQALMSAILADPADDTPRLQLADWLEEQGDADRAEFIRVQCELAKWDTPIPMQDVITLDDGRRYEFKPTASLRRREWELWDSDKIHCHLSVGNVPLGLSLRAIPLEDCIPPMLGIVRRGLVAEVHTTLRGWMGGKCEQCEFVEASGYAQTDFYSHRPGGICKLCNGSGTMPGHGPAIVSRHPVERVVTEKRPTLNGTAWAMYRGDERRTENSWEIPAAIFKLMPRGANDGPLWRNFPSEQAARDALECHALIVWAKQQSAQTPTG